jgi:hypothetical protein
MLKKAMLHAGGRFMHWCKKLLRAIILAALSSALLMAQRGVEEKIIYDPPRTKSPPKSDPLPAPDLPLLAEPKEIEADEEDGQYGPQKFTCTIGGEAFEQNISWMGYPLEARPDGGALGSEFTDMMIPECPGNGLVMVPKHDGSADDPAAFAAYSAEEIAKLPVLIASAEYQAMRKEARYYRLYWIGKKLDRPLAQQLHLLQHISYITGPAEQEKRYLEFFISEVDGLSGHSDFRMETALRYRYFTANALRRLGRFDEARSRLAELEKSVMHVSAERLIKEPQNPHFYDGAGDDDYSLDFIGQSQLKAIAAGDTDRYPVSMMSNKLANIICNDADDSYPPATAMTIRACAQRKIDQAQEEKDRAEAERLQETPEKLMDICKETPVVKRNIALADACEWLDQQPMAAAHADKQREAERLLKNTKALDARCKDVVIPSRYASARTALGEACQQRAEVLREENGRAIAAKMRREPAEFERLCKDEAYDMHAEDPVERACYEIDDERDDAIDDAQRARLEKMTSAEIWAECEKTKGGNDVPGYAFSSRCADIRVDREQAAWQNLEAEPAKLAAACAIPYERQAEWIKSRCYSWNEEQTDKAAMLLAKDHAKLVASCKATPMLERDDVLKAACNAYRKCVIVRLDELPFDQVGGRYWNETPDPAAPVPACYDSVEEASAAYESYKKDPKNLRANGCKPSITPPGYSDEVADAEMCDRYAAGEDVFTKSSVTLSETTSKAIMTSISDKECQAMKDDESDIDCDAVKQAREEMQAVQARNKKREACIKKEMQKRGLEYTGSDKATGYDNVWEYCEAKMGAEAAKAGAEAMKKEDKR